nr:protein S100-Z [Vulpes vulpes]
MPAPGWRSREDHDWDRPPGLPQGRGQVQALQGALKTLLQREPPEFLSCQKDPQLVDKVMQDLDANKDNEVDFNEFVVMVAALTVACNDYFVEQLKKKGKQR